MNKIKAIKVNDDIIQQRIDNFILNKTNKLPKSLIYKFIRKGKVLVNNKKVNQKFRIKSGDIIETSLFNLNKNLKSIKIIKPYLNFLEKRIIYENKNYIIINKPSGISVHSNMKNNYGLIEYLRILRPKEKRLDLAHRLDKETSGCLILAKKHSSLVNFFNMFKYNKIDKLYYAIVHGLWNKNNNIIDLPLKKTKTKHGQTIVKINTKNGKPSITKIISVKYLHGNFSLLKIKLETGRTHQIRVHTKAFGYPIVGDKKYGLNTKNKLLNNNKLLLHARSLNFYCKKEKKQISIVANLDFEFKKFIKNNF